MWKYCELILKAIDSWVDFNSRRSPTAETEGEQASEIEALLVSIAGVVCKEAIDKSGDKFTRPTFPSEFALLALNRILPSFTTSLLLFPVVISNYFEILEVIIQVHPDLFAAMDGSSRVTMIESAKFAIQSNSEVCVDMYISAHTHEHTQIVIFISHFHTHNTCPCQRLVLLPLFCFFFKGSCYHERLEHRSEYRPLSLPGVDGLFENSLCRRCAIAIKVSVKSKNQHDILDPKKKNSLLVCFPRCLVKFMSENQSATLLEPLADALLPLLLLDWPGLMKLTLQHLNEPQLQPAFAALATGLTRELSGDNETRFRANLLPFLLLVRSLKTK